MHGRVDAWFCGCMVVWMPGCVSTVVSTVASTVVSTVVLLYLLSS